MPAPQAIIDLVERFEQNKADYRAGKYNETQVRREFLDPFFKALGWDVDNEQGYAEAYKDVVHEATVKVGEATKAPDYAFRIGGTRKFFVEAKKPSVNIKDDIAPAFQTRRYAWSAKLALSILTDFEEFAVYDCRVKPSKNDNAATARVMYFTFDEYLEKWDEIAKIFSREAVLKGSFDKFATSSKKQRGTAEVDDAFLEEIERWRDLLARNIALRNKNALSPRALNEAVQLTIDRIIFLRIAEGRGVEIYGQLRDIAENQNPGFLEKPGFLTVYDRLKELYKKADARYNSGLFHFGQGGDDLTLSLTIDDKPLKDILTHLYYPESPYVFSEIPADILGQVYERFLGKVIRLTPSGQAKVEEKPEVRKAGGVYYTPTYIVDYIVQNTVGALLEGKTPTSASKLKIIDPACGSGTFLLGAFEHLIQWHLNWYVQDDPSKWAKKGVLLEGREGWGLTLDEKKRILTNNLFGVDIDAQAVEVTKLSLLLKVIETPGQLGMLAERILPDLSANVKCGNSLIGSDYYDGKQMSLLGDEEFWRVNAFDWKRSFAEIFAAGGFDAVIGNPPYVRQESLKDYKDYFQKNFTSYASSADLYIYFIEKGVNLLNSHGLYSIIVSSSFIKATYGKALRNFLMQNNIREIVDFGGLPIFEDAKDTYVCIPLVSKKASQEDIQICKVSSLDFTDLSTYVAENSYTISPTQLNDEQWSIESPEKIAVFNKIMQAGENLGSYVSGKMYSGIKTGLNTAFVLSLDEYTAIISKSPNSKSLIKPFVGGQEIRRFKLNGEQKFLIVIPFGWTKAQLQNTKIIEHEAEKVAWDWFSKEHPALAEHLDKFKQNAKKRQDQGDFWWELRSCDYYDVLDAPKIIYPDIAKFPRFYLDYSGTYIANTAYCLGVDDKYLLAVLNSKLFWFAIGNISIPFGMRAGEYRYRLIYQYMEKVPIRTINFADPAEVKLHEEMVTLVERMLSLHGQAGGKNPGFSEKPGFSETKPLSPREKEMRQRQIEMTDAAIDQLVYRLYGLTEAEIGIVEGRAG